MFEIADGRTHFFQWDLDRTLVLSEKSIDKVHFCNRTSTEALVLDTYAEGEKILVKVPNILLQKDGDIIAYAFDANYTRYEDVFKVKARPKPADYVYTETEINTWAKLEQRMDAVESTVTTEGVAKAVEDYLADNPIEAGATAEEAAQIEANTAAIEEINNAGYVTKAYADDRIIEQIDYYCHDFVTADYVDDAIADIDVDLTDYVKNSDLEAKGYITTIPSEYVTENELSSKGFLTSKDIPDIPDVSAFVTEEDVIALIAEHGGGGGTLPASEESEF